LAKFKNKHFYIKIANIPKIYEEKHIMRFFSKQVANFKNSKMLPEYDKQNKTKFFNGNVLIQTNDK
jgi:type II secretory ATPase GspE/PulE/Tfp pilus assembly ATPase PilB-like protein